MKKSRNIKTVELIEALRKCSTPGVHCDGCVFCSDEDHEEPWCGDVLLQEAVRRLEEYTDRCARYAEEIAVLKAAGERVEWIPVTERLPEEDGFVIVWHDETEIALFSEGKFCFYDAVGCLREYVDVTHWAHLPQPPKGE